MPQIFLSATYRDLKKEREALIEHVFTRLFLKGKMKNADLHDQTTMGPAPKRPAQKIKTTLERMSRAKKSADEDCLFLLLVGFCYGSLVPNELLKKHFADYDFPKNAKISYTRLEYNIAQKLEIPCYVYVKNEKEQPTEFAIDQEDLRLRNEFLDEISETWCSFDDVYDLSHRVLIDVMSFLWDSEYKSVKSGSEVEEPWD